MRIIFLGTPLFAVEVLNSIYKSDNELVAVITQPDKVNGRSGKITYGPVKQYALEHEIDILQYDNISLEGESEIRKLNPDIMVTCAYGQILKQNILDICPIINVHASILPKYRGSSPVQWALINGESFVGVTIMRTELGVDTGDMILKDGIILHGDENSAEVLESLSKVGAKLIVKALEEIKKGTAEYEKQNEIEATYCRMLTKADGKIDFNLSALQIKNFIRGVTPWPGAYTHCVNGNIKISKVEVCEYEGGECPGEVVASDFKKGLIVKCGSGYISVLNLQGENSKAMDIKSYLLGKKIPVGSILGD